MANAYSMDTADRVGVASDELVRMSAMEGDTGAVAAYRDETGVWQYAAPDRVSHYRGLGYDVQSVYVEPDSEWAVGDRVEGGESDDHDTGRVIGVAGDQVAVAWDSGVRTVQHESVLRVAS